MKTYSTIHNNETYLYFYDIYIKLWSIFRIDPKTGYQIDEEADHCANKVFLLECYPFLDFKNYEEIEAPKVEVDNTPIKLV